MSEDGEKNSGESKPEDEAQPKKLDKPRRILPTPSVGVYILGGFAATFWGFGSALLNGRFIIVSWSLIFMGLCCACIAGRLWIINHKTKHKMPGWLDSKWTCPICIVVCLVACLAAALQMVQKEPKPNLIISLQVGNRFVSSIILTNDIFSTFKEKAISALQNGRIRVRHIPDGCLVIPIQSGESNAVLSFIVENDSSIKVTDLTLAVALPEKWNCAVDSSKWQEAGLHLEKTGQWRADLLTSNSWVSFSPYPLFPSDALTFSPITNFSVPTHIGQAKEAGMLQLDARSSGFEKIIGVNLLLVPVSSNVFKPFITPIELFTNGTFNLIVTPKDFVDSQK